MNETVAAEGAVSFDALCERGEWPRREGEFEDEQEGFGGKVRYAHLLVGEGHVSEQWNQRRERKAHVLDRDELKPEGL